MGAIDRLERGHADRAAGAVDQLDDGGRISSMPYLTILWVWPPQTSMIVQGRVTVRAMAAASFWAASPSRYSCKVLHDGGSFEFIELIHLLRGTRKPGELPSRRCAKGRNRRERARNRRARLLACSRQTRFETPPKSTLPISTSCSRYVSTTLPGTARHIDHSSVHLPRGRHRELTQADPPIVGGHTAVSIDPKTSVSSRSQNFGHEQGIHEDSAREHDRLQTRDRSATCAQTRAINSTIVEWNRRAIMADANPCSHLVADSTGQCCHVEDNRVQSGRGIGVFVAISKGYESSGATCEASHSSSIAA